MFFWLLSMFSPLLVIIPQIFFHEIPFPTLRLCNRLNSQLQGFAQLRWILTTWHIQTQSFAKTQSIFCNRIIERGYSISQLPLPAWSLPTNERYLYKMWKVEEKKQPFFSSSMEFSKHSFVSHLFGCYGHPTLLVAASLRFLHSKFPGGK